MDPLLAVALSAFVTAAFFAALALAAARWWPPRRPDAWRRRLGLGPGTLGARELAWLVLGTLALSHGLEAIIQLVGAHGTGTLGQMERALRGARGPDLALTLVCLAGAVGVGEELFFRGLLQRGLERRWARARWGAGWAVLAASAAFGAVHGDRVQSPGAFVLGVYLGIACWRSGGVRAPILCHVVNNALAILASAYALRLPLPAAWVAAGGGVIAAVALARVWVRSAPPTPGASHPSGTPTPGPEAVKPAPRSTD